MTRLLLSLAMLLPALAMAGEGLKPGDAAAGKRAFVRCASCHQVGPSARAGFGPQLNGIIGRKAGSTPDFIYSPAMKQSGIVWTEAKLAAFLRSPKQVVPDNKMRFWGIGDEQQIANLLAYLRAPQ